MGDIKGLGHIGVLLGGYSSEREISIKSGQAVAKALTSAGCTVSVIDIKDDKEEHTLNLLKDSGIDLAFIALHGALGEDGVIQELLESAGIPFTGSGVEASRTAINKAKTQRILKESNIPVPKNAVITPAGGFKAGQLMERFQDSKLVVKPVYEGSSIGISIVNSIQELEAAIEEAKKYGNEILVEEYIQGRELTVGILGEQALPVVEVIPGNNFYDYTAKYSQGMSKYIVPAEIPEELSGNVQKLSLKVHHLLGCKDFSRVDLIVDEKYNPYFLEINTIPGFTSLSLLPMAADEAGISFTNLCLKIIELAYAKKSQKEHNCKPTH